MAGNLPAAYYYDRSMEYNAIQRGQGGTAAEPTRPAHRTRSRSVTRRRREGSCGGVAGVDRGGAVQPAPAFLCLCRLFAAAASASVQLENICCI